jgi:hypothetical protein
VAEKLPELPHAAVEINANGPVRESGARGNFGAGHALDEAKDERFAIGVWQRAYGFENLVSFGLLAVSCGISAPLFAVKFLIEFACRARLAVKIGGAIAGDGSEPTTETRDVAK